MRVLLQRCRSASAAVDGKVLGSIDRGLLLLTGIAHDDTPDIVAKMAAKIANLRIFPDEAGQMNRSVLDLSTAEPGAGGVLVVSQFTLYADVRRGRRPSFTGAARPETAVPLLDAFSGHLAALDLSIATGRFGAAMQVSLVNDGPVTIWLDSADHEPYPHSRS